MAKIEGITYSEMLKAILLATELRLEMQTLD